MKDNDELPSLTGLGESLRKLRAKTSPQPKASLQGTDLAMRVGLELVSGVLVGAGAGIVLDKWLGTSPFLLLICFFLGTAAGFLTIYRTTQAMGSDETEDESDTKK